MARVTLYDARTGEVLGDEAAAAPEPAVSAETLSKVPLAVDPTEGRAFAQFVVEPGEQRLVADLVPDEDDTLADLHRAVLERLDETVLSMAPAERVPTHLSVFHTLDSAEAYVPDPEIGAHLVSTDEPLEVAVPNAVAATSVVAFFRGRAPWKVLAVQAPDAGVSDADVVITIDARYDDVTWLDRDESWVDEDAVPDNIDIEGETAEATGKSRADAAGATADDTGSDADDAAVLRLFEGATGEPVGGGASSGSPSERGAETARHRYAEGQVFVVRPDAGVVRVRLATGADGPGLFAEYEHPGPTGDLLASFAQALSARTADLGMTVGIDVGGDVIDPRNLVATPSRPDRLRDADVAYLGRSEEPLDFAAPDAAAALGLALYLRATLDGDPSVAASAGGRTDDLAGIDVVVAVDPDCDGVEPLGETVARLADSRLRGALNEVGGTVQAVANRIGEITGTVEAHQRVFAAALSGDALAERGLTVAPVDDDPLARRRKQARYLMLYVLVLAGVALGVGVGQFEPLVELLDASYPVELGLLATTPASGLAGEYAVGGAVAIGACLAALVVGAYWLFGYPLGPLAAVRRLATTVYKQVTGGAGSGTVPSSIAEAAAPVDDAIDELHAGYDNLAHVEGSIAGDAENFGAFLEEHLLTGAGLPAVTVVDREDRRRDLMVGIAVGTVVGTVAAAVVVGGLWVVADVAATNPKLVFDGLVAVVGLALVASLVKAGLTKYGGGRLPRWPAAR